MPETSTQNGVSDWVTLWQSELAAMAADRELRESWVALAALWASSAHAAIGLLNAPDDLARRTALAAQPAGATPLAPASEPGLDEVERLNHRIAALERRLAAIERDDPDRTA